MSIASRVILVEHSAHKATQLNYFINCLGICEALRCGSYSGGSVIKCVNRKYIRDDPTWGQGRSQSPPEYSFWVGKKIVELVRNLWVVQKWRSYLFSLFFLGHQGRFQYYIAWIARAVSIWDNKIKLFHLGKQQLKAISSRIASTYKPPISHPHSLLARITSVTLWMFS